MGNSVSEESVKNYVNDEIKEEVDDSFLELFNDITSKMNLKELETLKAMPNYDWIANHWANKANSKHNRQAINAIIDKKIDKEMRRSFGAAKRSRRRSQRA